MKKLLILIMALVLAGCADKEPEVTQMPMLEDTGPVVVERTNRLLVVPFDCTVLTANNASTMLTLQNLVSSQLVYMLQLAGVPAEQYTDGLDKRIAEANSYAALMPGGFSIGQGLLPGQNQPAAQSAQSSGPAISFEEVEDWNAQVVPPRNVRQYGEPIQAVAIDDTNMSVVSDDYVEAEPQFGAERRKLLAEAKAQGYDYIVTGTIALVRTDVSPTVHIAGADRATVRCEINTAFQLISTETGKVRQNGAARGRDARLIKVTGEKLNSYHVYGALDKITHESVRNVAQSMAEKLSDKGLATLLANEEMEDEASFYQDTPGKRLKPKTQPNKK